jgi:TrmH family RNA methyltransferase
MKHINALDNPFIKTVVALHDSKGRKETKQFIGEGIRVCTTLLESKIELVYLIVTEEFLEQAQALTTDDKITLVNSRVMNKISPSVTPSGILGIFEIPVQKSLYALTPGLVLARIADPGNMGTMIRTAVAFGIKSVVVVEGADPYSPKVVQASAGTIATVTLYSITWELLMIHKKELILAGLVMKGGENPSQIDKKKTLLVVGSEAHGIPAEWIKQCEQKISIPMPGGAESLNAAIAASIALYWGWLKK